jgi:DNA-directed RNA polymerase specialized sigma24 family protein
MDCPEGTVKSRLHYALRQVRLGMQTTYRTMNKESFLHK